MITPGLLKDFVLCMPAEVPRPTARLVSSRSLSKVTIATQAVYTLVAKCLQNDTRKARRKECRQDAATVARPPILPHPDTLSEALETHMLSLIPRDLVLRVPPWQSITAI